MSNKYPIQESIASFIVEDQAEKRAFANNNISKFVDEAMLDQVQKNIEEHFQEILLQLGIDIDCDHNTKGTAARVAKMFVREIFNGKFTPKPRITTFPNVGYDQILTSGPIAVRSMCAHHFMPITGKCWIGMKPGEKVIGLSKFNRIVDWVASRPQIQEEMTEQIANEIENELDPIGLAVVIKAEHFCITHRGVKEHDSDMTTSILRGVFRKEPLARQEVLGLITNSKGYRE